MTNETEYGPEIVVDGGLFSWWKLEDDIQFIDKGRDGKVFKLPASHPYYAVQSYNAKHSTQFKYWPGGERPDDWGGGYVLYQSGVVQESSERFWAVLDWGRGQYDDIIGYTPKPCAPVGDEPKDGANLKFNDCPLGLYRVYWESGGSSLAAIGFDSKGDRWIAPTNWLTTARMRDLGEFGEIAQLQPLTSLEDEYAQAVDDQEQPDFVPCERTVRLCLDTLPDRPCLYRCEAIKAIEGLLPINRAEELADKWLEDADWPDMGVRIAVIEYTAHLIAQGEIRG